MGEIRTVTPIVPTKDDALIWAKVLVDHGFHAHVHEIAHGPPGAPAVIVAGFYVRTDASEAIVAQLERQAEDTWLTLALQQPSGQGS